ncbi:MAG: PQQ-binding-like beta-propeller repeat protein [Candidatus Bathyarchaeota archaeon]|nr:PQQ-binding-like beta-propeller repeat protein [Candidatus Bathyarchaeota archaeon]
MQTRKTKTMAIAVAMLLISSLALAIVSIQPTSGEVINGVNYDSATAAAIKAGMTWGQNANASANRLLLWDRFHDKVPTWSFLIAAPNPVGVGQTFNLVLMNPQVPQGALLTNDIRYTFSLKVEKPNGEIEMLPPSGSDRGSIESGGIINGKYVSDSTGSTFAAYTPDQTGNYTITLFTDELFFRWNDTASIRDWTGITLLASNYTLTVHVQDEQVSLIGLPNIQPTPTEYWTRPIEGQNDQWYTVSSNWLSGPRDRDNGGGENRYQADGIAPNSPHILWTRPTEDNGIVGGGNYSRDGVGNAFNAGSQYQPRFTNPIIMYGRLYYSPNVLSSGASSFYDCIDLKTGELLWETNTGGTDVQGLLGVATTANTPQFGYYYSQDDGNEHGIQNPGWLFSSNFQIGYQPERGIQWLNITNVPRSGTGGTPGVSSTFDLSAPNGEILRYVIGSSAGTYYLGQWNSSKVIPMLRASFNPPNTAIDGNTAAAYDYNKTLAVKFSTAPTIRAGVVGDFIWGSNGTWPTGTSGPNYAYPSEVTIWKISLKPENFGQIVYMTNLDVDDEKLNSNNMFERATGSERRFVTLEVPQCIFHIYDMDTGKEIAQTEAQSDWNAYGYFTWPSLISQTQTKMAYGMLYTGGYTGAVSAYDLDTGDLVWRQEFPSGGAKIQNYVQMLALISDGKVFVGTHEHSADTPLYKGERVHALNATTGEIIWDMSSWAYPMTFATADGVLIYWNNYDAQVYAIGKGPSQMTVTAPDLSATLGSSVTIKGTVTDISAGTQQDEQAARFPNGVPAVSDSSQAQWMEYVYMQKGRPTNATGVPVTLSVIDGNGNYREIGQATSNADGFFSFNWKPDISGTYTVYASFAGSESYWPSHAVTAFSVDEAAATATPVAPVESAADQYFIPAIAGLFVAIIAIGLLTMLLVLRKK